MVIGVIVFISIIALIGYVVVTDKPLVEIDPPIIPPVYIKPDPKNPDAPTVVADLKAEADKLKKDI